MLTIEGIYDGQKIEPLKPIPFKKKKKVVILETKEQLANNTRKDVPVPITIRAYATDNKEKIVVDREVVFFYPRADLVKK